MISYLRNALSDWRSWWDAPTTKEDRQIAAFIGAIGGFIIGLIAKIFLGTTPAPWEVFAIWAAGGAVIFAFLGFAMPKPIMLVCAPFVRLLEGV